VVLGEFRRVGGSVGATRCGHRARVTADGFTHLLLAAIEVVAKLAARQRTSKNQCVCLAAWANSALYVVPLLLGYDEQNSSLDIRSATGRAVPAIDSC
jgi:hypothetical protein